MTSFATFLSSFVIMVIFCLVGYNFALGGGSMMDQMQDTFIDQGLYEVSEGWDTSGSSNFIINSFYFLQYLFPIIGVGQFIVCVVRRQRYDHFDEPTIYTYEQGLLRR